MNGTNGYAAGSDWKANLPNWLKATTLPDQNAVKAATQKLDSVKTQPGFGLAVLELLHNAQTEALTRQAGAIYFKNYIRGAWDFGPEQNGVPNNDRDTIKQHILKLMLSLPKQLQAQLAAALEQIAETDFPDDWQNLLPELVQTIKEAKQNGDLPRLCGAMETAHSVFKRFRHQGLSKELKYVVINFQQVHLEVYAFICQNMMQSTGEKLKQFGTLLVSTCQVFYTLNVVDLPEFFEDNMDKYFEGFLTFLKYNNAELSGSLDDTAGVLEELKGQICDNLSLYAEKYSEEFEKFVPSCIQAVWQLLMTLDDREKNDYVVASGIHFLSCASATKWGANNPFGQPAVLPEICSKIILPNIRLRKSDQEMFEENPQEYIRRDIEGADQDTRRRSSIDFVKSLGRFYLENTTTILLAEVKKLVGSSAELDKDMCIYLVVAMAIRGQTRAQGVTELNPQVNVMQFLEQQVYPVLNSEPISSTPILRSSCIRYVTIFRNQLNSQAVIGLFPSIVKHLASNSAVLHTYAANAIERILSVKDRQPNGQSRPRFGLADMKAPLKAAIVPLVKRLTHLNDPNALEFNEYLMRCLMRIFTFLRAEALDMAVPCLQELAKLVDAVSKNPSNPLFNHYLFETIASIVRVAVPQHVDQVENTLLPCCANILQQNVVDFMPYSFQILGLLLDSTKNVKDIYGQVFAACLNTDLWKAPANVPGLVRLFNAFFKKSVVFQDLLKKKLNNIVECFRFVLNHKKMYASAFDLMNGMFRFVAFDIYQPKFQEIVNACLVRLHVKKTPKLQKDWAICMSTFVHKQNNHVLPRVFETIQAGLAANVIANLWLPAMDMMCTPAQRKISALGLANLITDPIINSNQQLLRQALEKLAVLLNFKPQDPNAENANNLNVVEESEDEGGNVAEFEASFAKLRNTDGPGSSDLAYDVADPQAVIKGRVQGVRQQILTISPDWAAFIPA